MTQPQSTQPTLRMVSRRTIVWMSAVALVVYGVAAWRVVRVADQQWFDPAPEAYGNWQPRDLPVEDVWFRSADGTRLNGWLLTHQRPRAVVLFLHGSAGNITHRADVLRHLHNRLQSTIMTFDYRGFGRSEGRISEAGLLADARAARAWLATRTGVAPADIVLIGRSLGAALAVTLAAEGNARLLALESAFPSLPEVAQAQYHWLPLSWFMTMRLDAASRIGRYEGPLLQVHGRNDEVVPLRLGQRLFFAAGGPRQFIIAANAGHATAPPEEYYRRLERLVSQTAQP